MKKLFIFIISFGVFASPTLFAEASVTLEGVHLCCKACVRGVDKAVSTVEGVTAVSDQDTGTVVVTAKNMKSLRKGVNAIVNGGFYGTSSDSSFKVRNAHGAKNKKVESITVTGVHLCCNGCVNAVEDALATVEGVSGNTAERRVDSFQVTGNFKARDVFTALNKAGFAGKVAAE